MPTNSELASLLPQDERGGAASLARPTNGFAVIVLAAGESPRIGRPAHLAAYRGRSLVEHATRTALASGACEVVVVAGEDHGDIARQLRKFRVRVVRNPQPSEGISSSIHAGLSRLRSNPAAAILSLCDQPKVTSAHLRALGERAIAANGPPVVASAYDGVLGAPCAFAKRMFPRLLELRGRHGARHLIRAATTAVEAIRFADANHELETSCSFQPLLSLYREDQVLSPYADSHDSRGPPARPRVALAA